MKTGHFLTLQALVFALVTAAFTNIYITQPVLPVLSAEFGINESTASFSVSAVILGIALANLPFGRLADRYSNKAGNGAPMALGSLIFGVFLGCTLVKSFPAIVAGLVGTVAAFLWFIPLLRDPLIAN